MAKAIHTMIRMLDEKWSVDFYGKALGFNVVERHPFDGFSLVYNARPMPTMATGWMFCDKDEDGHARSAPGTSRGIGRPSVAKAKGDGQKDAPGQTA